MGVPVFWIEPTDRVRRRLRRFRFSNTGPESVCPAPFGSHNAYAPFSEGKARREDDCWSFDDDHEIPAHDDARWPTKCDGCPYMFRPEDEWQLFHDLIYARTDNGETMTLRDCPVGAMWDATWYPWKGPDGISLMVAVPPEGGPGHDTWSVDSRASNCTMPNDDVHRCWVRHGDPRKDPRSVHVDKNGHTCAAGAGSIQTRRWHGFLDHGELVEQRK